MLRDVFRVVPRLCKLVVDRKVCLLCGGGGGVALVSRNGGQKLISKFVNFVNSLDLVGLDEEVGGYTPLPCLHAATNRPQTAAPSSYARNGPRACCAA